MQPTVVSTVGLQQYARASARGQTQKEGHDCCFCNAAAAAAHAKHTYDIVQRDDNIPFFFYLNIFTCMWYHTIRALFHSAARGLGSYFF